MEEKKIIASFFHPAPLPIDKKGAELK